MLGYTPRHARHGATERLACFTPARLTSQSPALSGHRLRIRSCCHFHKLLMAFGRDCYVRDDSGEPQRAGGQRVATTPNREPEQPVLAGSDCEVTSLCSLVPKADVRSSERLPPGHAVKEHDAFDFIETQVSEVFGGGRRAAFVLSVRQEPCAPRSARRQDHAEQRMRCHAHSHSYFLRKSPPAGAAVEPGRWPRSTFSR